jgi:hypothetical protein
MNGGNQMIGPQNMNQNAMNAAVDNNMNGTMSSMNTHLPSMNSMGSKLNRSKSATIRNFKLRTTFVI